MNYEVDDRCPISKGVKMRYTFHKEIQTKSGRYKGSDIVFKSAKNGTIALGRKYVKPRTTEHNTHSGEKMRAAAEVWQDRHPTMYALKQDLIPYTQQYNSFLRAENKLNLSTYQVYTMAVCKHPKPISSRTELFSELGNTVDEWIKNGYLPRIRVRDIFIDKPIILG